MWPVFENVVEKLDKKDEGILLRFVVISALLSILVSGPSNIKAIVDNAKMLVEDPTIPLIFNFLFDNSMIKVYGIFIAILIAMRILIFRDLKDELSQEIYKLNKIKITEKLSVNKGYRKDEIEKNLKEYDRMTFELLIYILLSLLVSVLVYINYYGEKSRQFNENSPGIHLITMILILVLTFSLNLCLVKSESSPPNQYKKLKANKENNQVKIIYRNLIKNVGKNFKGIRFLRILNTFCFINAIGFYPQRVQDVEENINEALEKMNTETRILFFNKIKDTVDINLKEAISSIWLGSTIIVLVIIVLMVNSTIYFEWSWRICLAFLILKTPLIIYQNNKIYDLKLMKSAINNIHE